MLCKKEKLMKLQNVSFTILLIFCSCIDTSKTEVPHQGIEKTEEVSKSKSNERVIPVDNSVPTSSIRLTELNNNETVIIYKEQTLIVRLPSNPSTGYRWHNIEPKGGIFTKVVSSTYSQDQKSSDLLGAGGHESFVFKPSKSGETELNLYYSRELNGTPAKRFFVTVIIK